MTNPCKHGWRGTAPENGERIVTPCPSCGQRTLFIGTGGHLTCGNLGPSCPEPGVERKIEAMKSEIEQLRIAPRQPDQLDAARKALEKCEWVRDGENFYCPACSAWKHATGHYAGCLTAIALAALAASPSQPGGAAEVKP